MRDAVRVQTVVICGAVGKAEARLQSEFAQASMLAAGPQHAPLFCSDTRARQSRLILQHRGSGLDREVPRNTV